jgi:hypothetical protein
VLLLPTWSRSCKHFVAKLGTAGIFFRGRKRQRVRTIMRDRQGKRKRKTEIDRQRERKRV